MQIMQKVIALSNNQLRLSAPCFHLPPLMGSHSCSQPDNFGVCGVCVSPRFRLI